MTETFAIEDDNGVRKEFDTRAEAIEQKEDLEALGADVELLEPNGSGNTKAENKVQETDAQPPQMDTDGKATQNAATHPDEFDGGLPDEPPGLEEDPISWAPSHFVDEIQGTPAINRKGYAVMAERFDIQVVSEAITLPSETDFEYAEFRAKAVTQDGKEYSGFGSAHVDRQDGDDAYLLGELAETRSMKRALAYATGMGITAVEELQGNL